MKLPLPWLLVTVACLTVTTLRADDAAERQIRAAVDALAKAKAYRRTSITTDLDTGKDNTVVAEAVQPNLFRVVYGAFEQFSDGKNNVIRYLKDGSISEGGDRDVKFIDFMRAKAGLKGLLEKLTDAQVEGHITFRDLPTTVIAYSIDSEGMISTGKLWVSEADGLPLKIESETHGETKSESGETSKINLRGLGSYEYPSSLKIVMP